MQQHIARRLSFSSAISNSNRAFSESSNLVRGSKIEWRRSSSAASAASDSSSEAERSRKRVSKNERRSMVESFVNKYRAMNSGKFPTVTVAKKEVGGSYYLVREVVQELQYKSQMPSTSMATEINRKFEPSTNSKDVLSSQLLQELLPSTSEISEDQIDEKTTSKNVPDRDSRESSGNLHGQSLESVKFTRDLSHEQTDDVESSTSEILGDQIKEKTTSKDVLDRDSMESSGNLQEQSLESDKFTRDLSPEQTEDAESPKKPFTWKNLKSLADSFLNMWRNL